MGWGRNTVILGLHELRTGITCFSDFKVRGKIRAEEKSKRLEFDITDLAEPNSHTNPKFWTLFKYTRITARAMRKILIKEKGWREEDLPCKKSDSNILKRLSHCLWRVQKAKPIKKIPD